MKTLLFSAIFSLFFALNLSSTTVFAKSITEDPNYSYEPLFTNPVCADYNYPEEVLANNGEILKSKPKNVYCSQKDKVASGNRPEAPQQRLVDWINNPEVTSVSLAYFSFSDSRVLGELCSAIKRGIKVRMVLDSDNRKEKAPQDLKACGAELFFRGHTSGISLAHIKLVLIETKDAKTLRLVFSSGNLTSGTVLHHENWNFVQVSRDSYFAQDHLCAYDGMIQSKKGVEFKKYMKDCRAKIAATPEDDIKSFFVPADSKAAENLFVQKIDAASVVKIAAHRFSNKKMIDALNRRLSSDGVVQLIVDDDVYWTQQGLTIGANSKAEGVLISQLQTAGAVVQFMETNHYEKLLHHNKFVIFDTDSVWTGAGNLTGAGFSGNYENFYYITIPEVVEKFQRQYQYMWKMLSTPVEKQPQKLIKPIIE